MARHTRLTCIAVCVLGATAAAAQHVLLPFSRHDDIPIGRRASEQQATVKSSQYAYLVDVEVGTPPQKLSLALSPATGDTWLPDANTPECSPDWYYASVADSSYYRSRIPLPACAWGSYNSSLSSTYLTANRRYTTFSQISPDYRYISGTNATDKLVVAGIQFDDYPMGVVSSSAQWIGTLGLGYNASSSLSTSSYGAGTYANVLDRLVSSGKIASAAYSMWLDNAEGTSGGILFGAVDTSRYTGSLVRFSAYNSYAYNSDFGTTVSAINGTSASGAAIPTIKSNDFPLDIAIGTAEVFSYLPSRIADQIADAAGATFNKTAALYTISCDAAKNNNTKFVFELVGSGGPTLNVETADLVVSPTILVSTSYGGQLRNVANTCLFGIQKHSSSSDGYYNLGGSLFRRSYLVFDPPNHEIAVAPAKFSGKDAPQPTIVAFARYGAVIPSSTCVRGSYCSTSGSGSGFGSSSGSGSNSNSGSGSGSNSNSNSNSNGNNYSGYGNSTSPEFQNWQRITIGVSVSFGVVVLVAVVAGVLVCKRIRKAKDGKDLDEEEQESDVPAMTQDPAVQNGARGSVPPPAPLPVIPERAEPNVSVQAPQLPTLSTVTPPEPTASANSNRASVAVSAISDEPAQATTEGRPPAPLSEPEETPGSPKGKGKEVDRSES